MKTLSILSIFILSSTLAMCQTAFFQQDLPDKMNPEERKLAKLVGKSIKMPLVLDTTCRSIFTVVELTVQHSKLLDSISFPIECPPELQNEFRKLVPSLKESKWTKILPDVGTAEEFKVLIPYLYSFESGGCYDKISNKDFSVKISSIKHNQDDKVATYALSPIVMRVIRLKTSGSK